MTFTSTFNTFNSPPPSLTKSTPPVSSNPGSATDIRQRHLRDRFLTAESTCSEVVGNRGVQVGRYTKKTPSGAGESMSQTTPWYHTKRTSPRKASSVGP